MDKRDLIKQRIEKLSAQDRKTIKSMIEKGADCFPGWVKDFNISQQSLNKYLKLLL